MELRPIQAGGHLNAMLFQKKIQKRNKLVQLICGTFFPVVSQHDIGSVMAVFFPYFSIIELATFSENQNVFFLTRTSYTIFVFVSAF